MEQKERLRIKSIQLGCFLVLLLSLGCTEKKEAMVETVAFEPVDVSQIPTDTVQALDAGLRLENGVYYYATKPFSGYIKEVYPDNAVKSVGSYYLGMQHGVTKTFYSNGSLRDVRGYKENIGYGRHYGYWANGKMKFDFIYLFDKREGIQKQWYEGGSPYAFLNYKDDKEQGLQQAWRENGKPYINYEVKDGFRYGLQKSALCYTLEDEKVKSVVFTEQVAIKK